MLRRHALTLGAVLLAGSLAFAADSPEQKPAAAQKQATGEKAATAKIDPNADELLRKMSDYVSGLQSFKLHASVTDQAVTKDGQKIQFLAEQDVSVRRPDKLRVDRSGAFADTTFRYDGKQFSIYGKKTGYYATAPAPGNLDRAIDAARSRYGIDAPGADLLITRPYAELMSGVTQAEYLGVEPVSGMDCHHLAFRGEDTDFQVWVQDGAQPVPCRYTITSKNDKAQPEFSVAMTNWEPNAKLPDDAFAFTPPPGSKKIELKAQEASAK